MGLALLDKQKQMELIRSGFYSQPQKPKINLPTSVKPQQNTTIQKPQAQPQPQEPSRDSGYDPKRLTTYPVYRGAQIALDKIEAFFGGGIERLDAAVPDPRMQAGTHFAVGLAEFLPTAFMSSAMVIPATEYIMREPSRASQDFMPAQGAMVDQIYQSALDDPARFTGNAVGMVIGAKGYAKIGGKGYGSIKKISPYYERGMRVYTGRPNAADLVTGRQSPFEYHYTLEGVPEKVYNPGLSVESHRYYHGTSRDFMDTIATSGIRGTTVNPKGKTGFERALFFGAPETGYSHFLPGKGAFIKLETTVKPLSRSTQALLDKYGPGKQAGKALAQEYYGAPQGELIPGVKPGMDIKYAGWREWEYMMKPGTKLYPKENFRTKAYGAFGLKKGTSFTVDPATGKTIEILEVTTKKPRPSRFKGKEPSPIDSNHNPFRDAVGRPSDVTGTRTTPPRPAARGGRGAPTARNLFRVFPEERGTRGRAPGDTRIRGNGREPTDRRIREVPDITGIRGRYQEPNRGSRGARTYRGRGDAFRIPTRPPTPSRQERIIPTQFIQFTKPTMKRKKDRNGTRSKKQYGNWDSFAFSEFLTNMPVDKFLGI